MADTRASGFPDGAAVIAGNQVFVYTPAGGRVLGRALSAADRHGATSLTLITDAPDGQLARLGVLAATAVFHIEGTSLVATPAAARPASPPAPDAPELIALLTDAGLDVVIEHGIIHGEVRGLEAARIALDEHGQPALYVGVGRFDQEANRVMYADLSPAEALAGAVSEVRVYRHRDAKPHPINRLGRERWLRTQVIADPALVGCERLTPVEPALPRANLRDPAPAAAQGGGALVICSVGIDLELIPIAVDLAARDRPDRIVFVQPPRDRHAVQERLARHLPVPSTFIDLAGEWP